MILPIKYFDQTAKIKTISAIGAKIKKKVFVGTWAPETRLVKTRKGIDYGIFEIGRSNKGGLTNTEVFKAVQGIGGSLELSKMPIIEAVAVKDSPDKPMIMKVSEPHTSTTPAGGGM